eukprot:6492515-Amphidinium_carterae.2
MFWKQCKRGQSLRRQQFGKHKCCHRSASMQKYANSNEPVPENEVSCDPATMKLKSQDQLFCWYESSVISVTKQPTVNSTIQKRLLAKRRTFMTHLGRRPNHKNATTP